MVDVIIKLKDDTLYKVESKGQTIEVRDYDIHKYSANTLKTDINGEQYHIVYFTKNNRNIQEIMAKMDEI